jgi:hypothetical protein
MFQARYWKATVTLSLLTLVLACIQPRKPSAVFYILDNQKNYTIEINGLPITNLEFYKPGLDHFEPSFRSYTPSQTYTIAIFKNSKKVFEDTYPSGTYVINATDNQWISVKEVAYGRQLGSDAIYIPPQGFGVYLITSTTDYAAFGFYKNAPTSIPSRRGSIRNSKFVQLRAGLIIEK